MTIVRSWCCLVLGLVTIAAAQAATIPIVATDQPVAILLGQTREFQFGTVPQANTTVLLRIKSRMNFPSLGGSMQFMRLTLNGREVQAAVGRSAQRLLNRPFRAPVAPGLVEAWYDAGAEGRERGWKVIYAPDFTAALAQKFYVGDPYEIVLDVTDLTNPVAENRLRIENTTTPGFAQANVAPVTGKRELELVIGSLEIETKPEASPMMAVSATTTAIINRGTPAAGAAKYRGEVLPGGGFAVHVGASTYRFTSSFSFPDAGFNRLTAGAPATDGQAGWQVTAKNGRVIAQGPDYTIARTVTFGPRRVEVADAITNVHREAPLGLCVRHELDLASLKDAPIRLAGNPDPSVNDYISYGNPSVHLGTPEGALGLIAQDDVFRNQAHLYVQSDKAQKPTVAGLRTEMLRLAPGETYTLQWSVYPVAGPDYYDFINLVREDWGANYTAVGPWRWGVPDASKAPAQAIGAMIKQQGIRFLQESDWVEWVPNENGTQRIAFATDVFSDYWAKRRQRNCENMAQLRQVSPDTKFLWYYNVMRESAADTLQRFPDGIQAEANGGLRSTRWTYTGATNSSYTMVPTLKNSFGPAALEAARRYLDDMKLDGIYWDEMEGIQFGQILITYNNFDGHSCLLDPKTWRIEREVGIVPLECRPFYDEVVRLVHERGGVLLCNGPTGSSHTLRDRVQRMVEVQHNDTYALEGNLQTPLGYMSASTSWDDFLRAFRMAMLPAVCIAADLPHDISQHLFPFTPIELHTGYLLGKERLVATHSGNYGWPAQQSLVQVRHFDNAGKLTTTAYPTLVGAEARTNVTLAPKEAIVLERVPLTFKPNARATAEVSQVQYGAGGVSLRLSAPQGGALEIGSGEFVLREGAAVTVRLGNRSLPAKVAKGSLMITVPAGFSGTVAVSAP